MEPHLIKIVPPLNQSYVVKKSLLPSQEPWHYHSDYEILLILKGKGNIYIGNKVKRIEEGSLMLIGANVPHSSQKDAEYYKQYPEEESLELVIQFGEKLMGKDFFQIPEFKHISEMLERANRVLKFKGETQRIVISKMQNLYQADASTKIIQILDILDTLAKSEEVDYVLPTPFQKSTIAHKEQRLNKVMDFTIKNVNEDISLETVADIASMTPSAFCRYFKKHLRKSYLKYLNDLRISLICNQLLETDEPVSNIVYGSGFRNISNFNRKFKESLGMSPQEYRKKFMHV
jgi:AraC-like DNA-binding protein